MATVTTALDIIRNAIDEITHHNNELSETIRKNLWMEMSTDVDLMSFMTIDDYLMVDTSSPIGRKRLVVSVRALAKYFEAHGIPVSDSFCELYMKVTSPNYLMPPRDGFEVARQNKGNFGQIITSGENAINIVKATVECLGFEGIDRAYGAEEVNKSIETLIKYFNCCRSKYLTTARAEE